MHRSPHAEETRNIVGLTGALVNQFREGEHSLGGSLIPFYERNIIHGWLKIEGGAYEFRGMGRRRRRRGRRERGF